MFCQNCGAELRLDSGFCGVCGTSAPPPRLHVDPKHESQHSQARTSQAQHQPGGSSRTSHAAQAKSQPTYQSPLPRHATRHVAPVASLEVPAAKASPSDLLNPPAPSPSAPPAPLAPASANGQAPGEAVALAETPATIPAMATPAATPAATPVASVPPPARPMFQGVPQVSALTQQALLDYYPSGWVPLAAPGASAPPAPPQSAAVRLIRATTGLTIPRDTPNRVAAGALVALLVSFFLPWIILSGSRTSALSVGWPIILPLLVVVGVGLTILLPERALYFRCFLALPLIVGCFFFGSALLLFLLSSAIAANTAGPNFLGVDVGFALFAVASLALAWAGYYKFVRELPLLLVGRLPLAPLPRVLRALAEKPTAPAAGPVTVLHPLQSVTATPGTDGSATPPGTSAPAEHPSA